jgi:hypothetical protein
MPQVNLRAISSQRHIVSECRMNLFLAICATLYANAPCGRKNPLPPPHAEKNVKRDVPVPAIFFCVREMYRLRHCVEEFLKKDHEPARSSCSNRRLRFMTAQCAYPDSFAPGAGPLEQQN